MKSLLIVLLVFCVGVFTGRSGAFPQLPSDYLMAVLIFMIFLMAIGVGADSSALNEFKKSGRYLILFPIATLIGSFVLTWIVSLFVTEYSTIQLLAVNAGFGFYSFASVYVKEMEGAQLGALTFFANLTRELVLLLFAPLFVKYFRISGAVSVGGASTLDVTLPVMIKFGGRKAVPMAIVHGFVLTVLVPVLLMGLLELAK